METKELHLIIMSPEKTLFDGNIERVTVPGSSGAFTILPQHAPILSSLNKGVVRIVTTEGTQQQEINGGFIEVKNNEVSICIE